MTENTFLGLQPYTEDDAYRFKGRTEESNELFRLIVRNDFTVCYAESGEGKTSLLNAGVFPLLRQNMYFPISITFTKDDFSSTPDSFDEIINRCINDSIAEYNAKNPGINVEYKICSTDFQNLDCQKTLQQKLNQHSWWKLRNNKPQALGLVFTPVFVFDQFEEVFNLPGSTVWTKKFFDWLEDVSTDSCPEAIAQKVKSIIGSEKAFPSIKEEKGFKAVFSLRKEFIGELDYWGMQKCFIPSLRDNRYCLKPLTYEGAKKVMAQQKRFEEHKVDEVLNYFVGQYSQEPQKTIDEDLPAIPALLLSVVCNSWEKDMNAFVSNETGEIGASINIILEKFYDETLDLVVSQLTKLDNSISPEQCQTELDSILFSLVDNNGKRIRTKSVSDSLNQVDFDKKYKTLLNDYRVIKVIKVDGDDYVELIHDCLCPLIAKRKESKLALETQKSLDAMQAKVRTERRRNRRYRNIFYLVFGLICLFLSIITTWSSSTGLKGWNTSISHQGVWTADDLKKFKYLALCDSISISGEITKEEIGRLSGSNCFNYNSALKKIYYDIDTVFILTSCDNLEEIVLGDNVRKADIYTDASCKSLNKIYIGENVSQLYLNLSGYNRDSLVIDVSPENKNYKWDYCFPKKKRNDGKVNIGFLWDTRNSEIVFMDMPNLDSLTTEAHFPNDFIKNLAHSNIFYESQQFTHKPADISETQVYCGSNIESFTLNENDTVIGRSAFKDCTKLKYINGYPRIIEGFAFDGCKSLEHIRLDSVYRVEYSAFNDCHSLKEITFSRNDTIPVEIGVSAFENCFSLKKATLPKILLVKNATGIFANCINLEEVYLPDTIKIYESWSEQFIDVPDSCISSFFANCPNITKVHISPKSCFRIDSVSNIVYYRDIPVIFSMAKNFDCVKNIPYLSYQDGILSYQEWALSYKKDWISPFLGEEIIHFEKNKKKDNPNWYRFLGCDFYSYRGALIFMFPDSSNSVVYLPPVRGFKGPLCYYFPQTSKVKEVHTPYAEPRMWHKGFAPDICQWSDVVLYVPWGTKDAYKKDYRFRDVKDIREDSFLWRIGMTISYAFSAMWFSYTWASIIMCCILIWLIYVSAKKLVKTEKEKYNITLSLRTAIFTQFCDYFFSYSIGILLLVYINFHIIFIASIFGS